MSRQRPKPTKLKLLNGNPGHRPLNKEEPEFKIPDGIPQPPDSLDKIGRKEWARQMDELYEIGLVQNVSLECFANYCFAYSVKYHLMKELNGITDINSVEYRDCFRFHMEASKDMQRWATEFGITPSSKTRVHAPKKEEVKNKWGAL